MRALVRPFGGEGECAARVRRLHRLVLERLVVPCLVELVVVAQAELRDEVRDDAKEAIVVEEAILDQLVHPVRAQWCERAVHLDDEASARGLERHLERVGRGTRHDGAGRPWRIAAGGGNDECKGGRKRREPAGGGGWTVRRVAGGRGREITVFPP